MQNGVYEAAFPHVDRIPERWKSDDTSRHIARLVYLIVSALNTHQAMSFYECEALEVYQFPKATSFLPVVRIAPASDEIAPLIAQCVHAAIDVLRAEVESR